MCGFLLRIIINAAVVFFFLIKLPGIFVDTLGGMLLGAALVGLANAAVPTVLSRLSMKVSAVALGGWTLAANLFMPFLIVMMLPGFQVSSVLMPLTEMLLLTILSVTLSRVIQDR